MSTLATVSNALITAILDGVALTDAQKAQLTADAGLSSAQVRDINGRTSILVLAKLWSDVLRLTGDDFVGLQIGAVVPGDRFGLAAHAALNSENFRQVLERFAKYAALINGMIVCAVDEAPDAARFSMRFHWDVLDLERHAVDITFVALVAWARRHLGDRFVLTEVRLKHSRVAAQERYDETFGIPVELGASTNEIFFEPSALDEIITAGNPELGSILDRYASTELSKIPILSSLPERIGQILDRDLRDGKKVELTDVADELHMTPRHLQRKLSESSTSFSALLDEARKVLAPALLEEPSANVEQVGFRLGYAEPTAFIRAFKKWYGTTPGKYRRKT